MMKYITKIGVLFCIIALMIGISSCEEDSLGTPETPFAPYVLSLGISSKTATTYYVVSTNDLMSGTINAVGKGIEQNGYHNYEQGNQTLFCIGGLGVTTATGITRSVDGYLQETGSFAFDQALSEFEQIDSNHMLGVEIPLKPANGNQITFYTIDINSISIASKKSQSILPIATLNWPTISGLCFSENKVYMTYFPMDPETFATNYTDTTFVAVYSYPEMKLETIMKDTRTGPAGSWQAFNGIFKTESGDMYIMSNSALSNGFSQSTKGAAFLRIPKGQTRFDDYFFDFQAKSGGLRPAHIMYIGNGLVYAEVSTLNPQTDKDRWGDSSLKSCIIDLNKQTITDIEEIPIHKGDGGQRLNAIVEGNYVYSAIRTPEGVYMYRTDIQTATAVRGAKISTTFVAAFYKLDNH